MYSALKKPIAHLCHRLINFDPLCIITSEISPSFVTTETPPSLRNHFLLTHETTFSNSKQFFLCTHGTQPSHSKQFFLCAHGTTPSHGKQFFLCTHGTQPSQQAVLPLCSWDHTLTQQAVLPGLHADTTADSPTSDSSDLCIEEEKDYMELDEIEYIANGFCF